MRESLALLRQGRFEEVLARCVPVLDAHPTYVPLRLLVCQALIGLRRETEAEAHLRYCLDLDPECGAAYRYLGEIALRRDHLEAAARHLAAACELCPGDTEARELLMTARSRLRRAAEAPMQLDEAPAMLARGTTPPPARRPRPPAARPDPEARRKLARGTESPGMTPRRRHVTLRDGFGDYLAEIGLLSRAQVRAALIYRRTRGVELGDAALALGFASEASLRSAAQAYYDGSGRDDRS